MNVIEKQDIKHKYTKTLTYSGLILVAFELVKRLIVQPIKNFYADTTFNGSIFNSYKADVLSRHKNEFEASLLYLRDFMMVIDNEDMDVIQSLREHRNNIAHDLPEVIKNFDTNIHLDLLEKTNNVLFKLSNHQVYMDIGADPDFKHIDFMSIKGSEYLLFEEIINEVKSIIYN